MATLSTLTVKLVGDISEFSSAMETAGSKISSFGRDITHAGAGLTAGVTLPIVGAGAAALVMGNQFNAGLANVISLVPEAAGEIEGLGGDIQALAVEMGASTDDMNAGLYQVVSAFGYTSDSMEILRTNAVAAAAGLATTSDAINLTSAVTKAYGDTSATAVAQVSDLALKTVQMGQTTFPELASSIGVVTPLASGLGVSMEELFGVMATGTGVTGTASQVSTQFRGILQSLMAPTASMTAAFAELGVASGEELIQMYGLEDGLTRVMAIAQASGAPLQSYIGSIEGQTLAMVLAGEQSDTWTAKTDALRAAQGTAQAAFAAQTQGVNAAGFAMQQAAVQVQTMTQQLGAALAPVILRIIPYVQQFMTWIQGLIQRFTELNPKTQTIILAVAALAAAIGPVLMVIGPIVTGFGAVISVLGALISPIGLVVAAVAALALAWATDFGGIRTTVTEFWNNTLLPAFTEIKAWLEEHIPPAIRVLADFWTNTLLPAIQAVWAFIDANIVPLLEALVNLYIASLKLALTALAWVWQNVVMPALREVWEFLRDHVIAAFVDLKAKLDGPVNTALTTFRNLMAGPVATALGVVEGMMNALKGAINGIVSAINSAIGWLQRLIDKINAIPGLPGWLTPGSPTPFETGLRGIADALQETTGRLGTFGSALSGLSSTALNSAAGVLAMADALQGLGMSLGSSGMGGGGVDIFELLRQFLERLQAVAEKMDLDGLDQALALAEAAAKIGSAMKAAIEGITLAMTFELPAVDNIDALFHALRFFVARLATTAYLMQWKVFDQAVALAEAAGKIGGAMKAAIEGITLAMTFRVDRIADGTDLLFAALATFMTKLQDTASAMNSTAYEGAVALAEAAGAIGKNVKDAITGILAAMEFRVGRMADGTDLFVSQMAIFVSKLADAGRVFDADGLKAATALAEAAGRIGKSVEDAILGMTTVAKYAGLELVAGAKLFAEDAATLVRELRTAALGFDAEGLDAAADFASAAGTIGGRIEDAIKGLKGIMTYAGGLAATAVTRLATDLATMVEGLRTAAGAFDGDALAAAQALATAAGEIGGSISATVDGLTAIMAYAGGLTQTAVDRFMIDLDIMVRGLQDGAARFSETGLAAAVRLATAAQAIGDGVTSMSDAMAALVKYVAPNPARLDEFAADVYTMIEKLRIVASVLGDDAIDQALHFAEAGAAIYQAIEDGIDSILGINEAGSMAGVGVALNEMVDQVVLATAEMTTRFGVLVADARDFGADWVQAIMDGLNSRLGDLEALMDYIRGLFPSSPAKYGAWRDLPDGQAVGETFTGALAQALAAGADGVSGALGALRAGFESAPSGAAAIASAPTGGATTINVTVNAGGGDAAQVERAARLGVLEAARSVGWA